MAKKPPLKPVDSNSYEVEIDGEIYHPHEGETVTFRSKGSVEAMMLMSDIVAMSSDDENPTRIFEELKENGIFYKLIEYLARNITSWTWTDQEGVPYENPPSFDTLKTLDFTEIYWLMINQTGNKKPVSDDERKN